MRNNIKLIFENKTYYLSSYVKVLHYLFKLEYTFKIYKVKENSIYRYFFDVYKNNKIIYSFSIKKLDNYNAFDYLISSFISEHSKNIYMFNDFLLTDFFTGEIIESNENEKEYNIQLNILKNNYYFIFKDDIIFLNMYDNLRFYTKKQNLFEAEFFKYICKDNDKYFYFRFKGIRDKMRFIVLSEKDINNLYHSVYNLDTNYQVDYSTYLIYKFNFSYNLMKNPRRILSLNDIVNFGCERGI